MSNISVDKLGPIQKSLIDLNALPRNSFDSLFVGYDLESLLDDVILIEFVDEAESGNEIVRNGILVPINADTKAWRIGKVILHGGNVRLVKKNDLVCFPNNMGIPIANIDVINHGTIKHGIFLNEQRIFGVVKPRINPNDSIPSKLKKRSSK